MRVSAIVPAYNHARFVAEAVASALTQSHPCEVVVVDDGSTDETPAALAAFGDRIRVLRQQNRGVSAARNRGVAACTGEVVAFLDADDVWHPHKVARQVERLAARPDVTLVHCAVVEIDGIGRVTGGRSDGGQGDVQAALLRFGPGGILGGGSGALLPRATFERLGGFDEGLSTSADWDLYRRAAAQGPVAFVDEPLLLYRVHGANMHRNVARMEREMLRAYDKAFAEPGPPVPRDEAYARLHLVLAGSYFDSGAIASFLRHATSAIAHDPATLGHFARYPLRVLGRAMRR